MIGNGLRECADIIDRYSLFKFYRQIVRLGDRLEDVNDVAEEFIPTAKKVVETVKEEVIPAVKNGAATIDKAAETIQGVIPVVEGTKKVLENINTVAQPLNSIAEGIKNRKKSGEHRKAQFKSSFDAFAKETRNFFHNLPANTLKLLAAPMALIMYGINEIENLTNKQKTKNRSTNTPSSPKSPESQQDSIDNETKAQNNSQMDEAIKIWQKPQQLNDSSQSPKEKHTRTPKTSKRSRA